MRNPIENISRLQTQLNDLQLENQILKNILDNAGISYRQELVRLHSAEELCDYDPNQGARIQAPVEITEKMAVMFYSRFWGRQDVYAKRNEKRTREKLTILRSAITFGRKNVPKSEEKRLIVRIADTSHTNS